MVKTPGIKNPYSRVLLGHIKNCYNFQDRENTWRQSSRHCVPESNLVDFGYILNINLLIWSTVEFYQRQYPTSGEKHSKLSYFLLILSNNKENVTFTWSTGVHYVLFFTITGEKFVIYVPIRRYGDFNTLWLHLRMHLATSGC